MKRPTEKEIRAIIQEHYEKPLEKKYSFIQRLFMSEPDTIAELKEWLKRCRIRPEQPFTETQHCELIRRVSQWQRGGEDEAVIQTVLTGFPLDQPMVVLKQTVEPWFSFLNRMLQRLLRSLYTTQRTEVFLAAVNELTGRIYLNDRYLLNVVAGPVLLVMLRLYLKTPGAASDLFSYRVVEFILRELSWDRKWADLSKKHLPEWVNNNPYFIAYSSFLWAATIQLSFDIYYGTRGFYVFSYLMMRISEGVALLSFRWLMEHERLKPFQANYPFCYRFLESCVTDTAAYAGLYFSYAMCAVFAKPQYQEDKHRQQHREGQHNKDQERQKRRWGQQSEQRNQREQQPPPNDQDKRYHRDHHRDHWREESARKPRAESPREKKKTQKPPKQKDYSRSILNEEEVSLLVNRQACVRQKGRCCTLAQKALELKAHPTEKDIKKAFRKLSLLSHPDKCHASGCEERFVEVSQAREVLKELCL